MIARLNAEVVAALNSQEIKEQFTRSGSAAAESTPAAFDAVIKRDYAMWARENTGAVIVVTDPLFNQQARQIAELAAKIRLPSIATFRESAEAGVLMSYGTNNPELFRRVAVHVDKILKGAKPGDLPIERPTKFELIINGKTAKALGLKIPHSLLISAEQVIE